MKKYHASGVALVCAAVLAFVAPGTLAATTTCDTTLSNTQINGGLEVPSGAGCVLDNVTVNGGVVVDSGAFFLDVENGSTINGGLVVNAGSELGVGFFGGPQVTINGGLVIGGTNFAVVSGALIKGGVSITGSIFNTAVCGNDIRGNVTISNVSSDGSFWIGDPEDAPPVVLTSCTGNSIRGSLTVSNSGPLEVEGNTTTGSVSLNASTLELNGNTIGGSLSCSGGTVIQPPAGPDPSGNTVHGSNTCP